MYFYDSNLEVGAYADQVRKLMLIPGIYIECREPDDASNDNFKRILVRTLLPGGRRMSS